VVGKMNPVADSEFPALVALTTLSTSSALQISNERSWSERELIVLQDCPWASHSPFGSTETSTASPAVPENWNQSSSLVLQPDESPREKRLHQLRLVGRANVVQLCAVSVLIRENVVELGRQVQVSEVVGVDLHVAVVREKN
jgi:hypothetical protein